MLGKMLVMDSSECDFQGASCTFLKKNVRATVNVLLSPFLIDDSVDFFSHI